MSHIPASAMPHAHAPVDDTPEPETAPPAAPAAPARREPAAAAPEVSLVTALTIGGAVLAGAAALALLTPLFRAKPQPKRRASARKPRAAKGE